MKPRLLPLLLIATAAQLSTASAALTVFTSFEGSASSTPNDLGFSSSTWTTTAAGGTNSAATFTAGNITTLPTAYVNSGFVNFGNFLQTNNSPTFQTLSSSISVASASTTYFSFLYRTTASVGQGGGLSFFNGTTELSQIGVGGGGALGNIRITGGTQVNSPNGSFISGTDTAWIVGKIVTTSGADSISINVYTGTDAVGAEGVWDVMNNLTIGSDITSIRFNSPTGNNQQFDEFRMGTTFADVVPEPSALLLSGLGALSLAFRRSRSVRA